LRRLSHRFFCFSRWVRFDAYDKKVVPLYKRIQIKNTEHFIKDIEQEIDKYKSREQLREVFEMKPVFEKFERERDERIIQLTIKVVKMLASRKGIEEIAKETGLNIEQIQMIQSLKNNDKDWDKIDKIADKNGGHY
jgi:predicted transposase YdaD